MASKSGQIPVNFSGIGTGLQQQGRERIDFEGTLHTKWDIAHMLQLSINTLRVMFCSENFTCIHRGLGSNVANGLG